MDAQVDAQACAEKGFPTLRALFDEYDATVFGGVLQHWTIQWSDRMRSSAGLCEPRKQTIRISSRIHQFRSVQELRETVVHEMIHAYLSTTGVSQQETAHGPSFQKAAKVVGELTQLRITTYHHFNEEVAEARKTFVWYCEDCRAQKPGRNMPGKGAHARGCKGVWRRSDASSTPPHRGARSGGAEKAFAPFSGPGYRLSPPSDRSVVETSSSADSRNGDIVSPIHCQAGDCGASPSGGCDSSRHCSPAGGTSPPEKCLSPAAMRAVEKARWLALFSPPRISEKQCVFGLSESMVSKGLLSADPSAWSCQWD